MNTEELKLWVTERLKNRIRIMANERGISMNKMSNYILEYGIYKLFEEESEYGKLPLKNKTRREKKMKYPHITITDELNERITNYAKTKKIRFSTAVEELTLYGFKYIQDNKNYEVNSALFEKILSNEKYIKVLLEQLYSDMYMEAKTNPKDNIGLKTIRNRLFKKDFYD